MMLPKPKKRKKNRNGRGVEQKAFRRRALNADGNRCMDKSCKCHKSPGSPYWPEAHHIIYRSQLRGVERNRVENGITLCQDAHRKAHNGHGSGPDRVSAAEYMIRVLESHQEEATFRWAEALEELKKRRDRKR